MSADDHHARDTQVPGIHSRVAFPSDRWFSCGPSGARRQYHEGETAHLSQSKIIQIVISFIRPLSGNVDENLLGIRDMRRAFQSSSLDFP